MMNEYTCMRGGMRIYCRAYVPGTGEGKYPAVIMCHGFNGSYKGNIKYADVLTEAGIASILFDFCGGSMDTRSDGEMIDMTVSGEVQDLKAVIDFSQSLGFVDTDNLFVMGKSQGGAVAALTAADIPEWIRGLILLYPAFTIPYLARTACRQFRVIPEKYELLGGVAGKGYICDALRLNMNKCFDGYGGPVLILHGGSDDIVPAASSVRAADRYRSAELKIIPGAGHGFSGKTAKAAGKLIAGHILKNISIENGNGAAMQ